MQSMHRQRGNGKHGKMCIRDRYSIDEVFMDVTAYLSTYKMTAHELALKMIRDVLGETGVTATDVYKRQPHM